MNIYVESHIKALTENLELMTVAFIIALFADCLWITRDLLLSGATYSLIIISSLLWLSLALVLYAFIRYHYKQYKILVAERQSKLRDYPKIDMELAQLYEEYKYEQGE